MLFPQGECYNLQDNQLQGSWGSLTGCQLGDFAVPPIQDRMQATKRTIEQSNRFGIDLFQVSVHDTDCEKCLRHQGKVYSYSGKDPDFPKLEERPPFHEACRHVLMGYVPRPSKPKRHAALRILSNRTEPIANSLPGYDEALKIVERGQSPITVNHVLGIHSILSRKIKTLYKLRDSDATSMAKLIQYCEEQIVIAPKAAKELKRRNPDSGLPPHLGFARLAGIREKHGDFEAAMDLCRDALRQGWGDEPAKWEKRIEDLQKKSDKKTRTLEKSNLKQAKPPRSH